MLTYGVYMQKKVEFDERMRNTRMEESEKVKALEEERQQTNSQLFQEFVDKKHQNNQEYADKIRDVRSDFITERRKIYEESNILTCEWRAQLLKLEAGDISRAEIYEDTPSGEGRPKIDVSSIQKGE